MQVRGFKVGLAVVCLTFGLPALATTYDVPFPASNDATNPDVCSLTKAVQAINTQQTLLKDGTWFTPDPSNPPAADTVTCVAGNGSDIINLSPKVELDARGNPKKDFQDNFVYDYTQMYDITLTDQLVLGNQGFSSNVTIQLKRGIFDRTIYGNPVIRAAANKRIFFVTGNMTLSLKGITLEGGDISGLTDPLTPADPDFGKDGPNGGVIYTRNSISLTEGSQILNGKAENGGGIYLNGGNLTLSFSNAILNDNEATVNGGAIGMDANTTVNITGTQFNLFNNKAVSGNGGGIYAGGKAVSVNLQAGTFYNNEAAEGAAIDFQAGYVAGSRRFSLLNNLAIVGNTGGAALHYADLCQQTDSSNPPNCTAYAPPGAMQDTDNDSIPDTWIPDVLFDGSLSGAFDRRGDAFYNSVLVGNAAGCSFSPDPLNAGYGGDPSDIRQYLENAYSVIQGGSGCPVAEQASLPGNASATPSVPADPANNATLAVLSGVLAGGAKCNMADPGCGPRNFGRFLYQLQGFLPADFTGTYPTLVNAASPDDQTVSWLCRTADGRGLSRADTCDVGALELRIAAGASDNLDKIVAGKRFWLDVVKNDLGDMSVDCNLVAPPCLDFIATSLYGASLQVVYAAGPLADAADGTAVFSTSTDPGTAPSPSPAYPYPLVLYLAPIGTHVTDSFMYEIPRAVISGETYAGWPPRAQTNLLVAPPDNFTSATIKDFKSGSLGAFWLFGLALLGALRRTTRPGVRWMLTGVLLVSSLASADIIVNDLGDPPTVAALAAAANDNRCTLREALQRSFDNYPVPNNDCAAGAQGTDTIILPGPATVPAVPGCTSTECVITLNAPLAIDPFNSVVLQGQGVSKTIIDGNGQFRIGARSPLALRYLTVRNGRAAGGGQAGQGGAIFTDSNLTLDHVAVTNSQADGEGGAIFLSYGDNKSHALSVLNSYIAQNQGSSGGAISTVGQSQQLSLAIDNTTFEGNAAVSGKGGAINAVLATGGTLSVVNSILTGNSTTAGASAIDLSSANNATNVYLLNNTFYNNVGGDFLDSGNSSIANLSNSIVAGAQVGCSSGTGRLKLDSYNLFTPSEPGSCGNSVTAMSASLADVTAALNNGVLSAATGDTVDYLPPLFMVNASAPIVVDQGNPAGLVGGTVSPAACRLVDMRGKSRQSGAHCDVGAVEVQIMTVLDDTGSVAVASNSGEPLTVRQARTDVLINDLPSDGSAMETDTIGFPRLGGGPIPGSGETLLVPGGTPSIDLGSIAGVTPAGIRGTLKWVKIAADDPDCEAGDKCGLLFEFTKQNQTDTLTAAAALPEPDKSTLEGLATCPATSAPPIAIPYVAHDQAGNTAQGVLSITMHNLPPQFPKSVITVFAKPDESVDIPITVDDPDGRLWNASTDAAGQQDPVAAASWTAISIPQGGDPLFAQQSGLLDPANPDFHPAWGVGIKWNNSVTAPVITYTRANKTQVFNDSFKIAVRDNCGALSLVTVKVLFPQKEAAGGDLLKGGSIGFGLLVLAGLGLLRRRRYRS